jgi:ParB family transcriptional regulator, chromosome partitioning protein
MNKQEIVEIIIEEILVANPRKRNRAKWLEIVSSIQALGLKRPITVSRRAEPTNDGKVFDLVCGQGRIEAFIELGKTTIPAIVRDVSREDQMLMSLVENLARRQPSHRDILREVQVLRERGYHPEDIAIKLGVDRVFIYGLVHLMEHGEESLVEHVEAGRLPVTVAVEIARGNDHAISLALSEAYQSGQLRGARLSVVRKLVAARASKLETATETAKTRKRITPKELVRVYERTVQQQKALVAQAAKANSRILLLASIFRQLLADENFVNLLQIEKLSDMPQKLAERLK